MGAIKIHELKIKPEYFSAVCRGDLNFQIRFNDRIFKVGDILKLEEFDTKGYTGRYVHVEVIYILDDPALMKPHYVGLATELRIDRGIIL